MEEIHEKKYCNICKQETLHVVREGALEIRYTCQSCYHDQEIVKTFF